MGISLFYGFCFSMVLIILLSVVMSGEHYSVLEVVFIMICVVGTAGYYALATSETLSEAILATKMVYVIGVFLPLFVFLIVCDVCKIKLKRWVVGCLFFVQLLIYSGVLTTGYSDIYYKNVSYHVTNGVAYLTKDYGPLHFLYLVSMYGYVLVTVAFAIRALYRKNTVSAKSVDLILTMEFLTVIAYATERIVKLEVELLPIICLISLLGVLHSLKKLNTYSIETNANLCKDAIRNTAYIMIDRKLKYMGCNDKALELFPELDNWMVDSKIPGEGGRFNTYLRQPLLHYIKLCTQGEETENEEGTLFNMGDNYYRYVIGRVISKAENKRGYVIKINDVTEYVRLAEGIKSEQESERAGN